MNDGPHFAPVIDRAGQGERFGASYGAIESEPGHRFGMDKMFRAAANLPQTLVWLTPDRLEVREQFALQRPARFIGTQSALSCLMKRVHHFAENIELALAMGGIADADRLRAAVSREPGHLPFRQPPLATQAIHDLNLRRTSGDRA